MAKIHFGCGCFRKRGIFYSLALEVQNVIFSKVYMESYLAGRHWQMSLWLFARFKLHSLRPNETRCLAAIFWSLQKKGSDISEAPNGCLGDFLVIRLESWGNFSSEQKW